MATSATVRLDRFVPHRGVEDLLMWRDLKKSGIVFGSFTFVYVILELSGWSFIALVSNTLALIALGALVWANLGGIIGRPGPPVPKIFEAGLDEDRVKQSAERAREILNKAIFFAGRLINGKEPKLTLQIVFGLYLFGLIGRNFTVLTFAYLVVLLAFTVPKAYEMRKDDADKYLELAHAKTKEYSAKATEKTREYSAKFKDIVLKKMPKGASPVAKTD